MFRTLSPLALLFSFREIVGLGVLLGQGLDISVTILTGRVAPGPGPVSGPLSVSGRGRPASVVGARGSPEDKTLST